MSVERGGSENASAGRTVSFFPLLVSANGSSSQCAVLFKTLSSIL